MRRAIEPGKRLVEEFSFRQETLPTSQPIIQYVRQSTYKQLTENTESAVLQDEKLRGRLIKYGWKPDNIILISEDTGKSGQKRRDERAGLDRLYRLIETGQAGAVACFDASRLYRDVTRIQYTGFVGMCENFGIPVITFHRVYFPTKRQDMDQLIEDFKEAAKRIQWIHDTLLAAKLAAIEDNASFGGHAVPMGYIAVGKKAMKRYVVYEEHAWRVRWLYKRYRELDGNLPRLLHQLRIEKFSFPPFVGVEKVPSVALDKDEDGNYIIKSRSGLVSILSNVGYLGYYLFSGVLIDKEAHEAIVPLDDFMFAYNRLSKVTLDGEPNENRPTLNRLSHKTEHRALLEGVLQSDGKPAYVMMGKGFYDCGSRSDGINPSTALAIPIDALDRDFSAGLRFLLADLEKRHQEELKNGLYARLMEAEAEKIVQIGTFDKQLVDIDRGIVEWEMAKRIAMEELEEHGVREATLQLKRLRSDRAELEAKSKQASTEQADLEECKSLLDIALHHWHDLKFERKQRFVKMMVKRVEIEELSSHILQLTIELLPPFEYTLYCYSFRHRGNKHAWTDEEKDILKLIYSYADRADILEALPDRSWQSCARQGTGRMELTRDTALNTSGIHVELTWSDAEIMRLLGMDPAIAPWEMDIEEDPITSVGDQYVSLNSLLTDEELQRKSNLGPENDADSGERPAPLIAARTAIPTQASPKEDTTLTLAKAHMPASCAAASTRRKQGGRKARDQWSPQA